jgi:heme-degrading monooxygenase HmoA
MAVAVIAVNPGGTADQDEAIQKQLNLAENPPAGALVRLAGPVEGGWRIISVWESEEAFHTFRRERLEPALQQAGRPVPQFEIAPLHSVRIAPQQR